MKLEDDFADFPFLYKVYVQVRMENLDQYCDLLGYGNTLKNHELTSKTLMVLQKNVDCTCFGKKCLRYRIIRHTGSVRNKMQFKPGQEFREFVYGNGFGKSLITFEDNRMTHVQKGKMEITTVTEFYPSNMIMTTTVGHLTVRRYFDSV